MEQVTQSMTDLKLLTEESLRKLFSEGCLAEKKVLADQIAQMRGLELFVAEVPWVIALPAGDQILGVSENMKTAVHDLSAQLAALSKTKAGDTKIHIDIDGSKLPGIRPGSAELKKNQHG